jgi:hypothetical protein
MDGEASEGVAPARAPGLALARQRGRSTHPTSRAGGPGDHIDGWIRRPGIKGAVVLLRAVEAVLGLGKATLRGLSPPSASWLAFPPKPVSTLRARRDALSVLLSPVRQTWVHKSHKLVPDTRIGSHFGPKMIGHDRPPLEPRRKISAKQA